MQELMFAPGLIDLIKSGEKIVTIRNGRRDIQLGKLQCKEVDSDECVEVDVYMILYCKLFDIPIDLIKADGFENESELLEGMKNFYSDIKPESESTVIIFS